MKRIVRLADYRSRTVPVSFSRPELSLLLSLYSRRVSSGEWRDYAIDHGAGAAVFSVFRRSEDLPAYTITKSTLDGKGRMRYRVSSRFRRLKECHSLVEALSVFEHKLRLVSHAG
jgi:hypothetical protein